MKNLIPIITILFGAVPFCRGTYRRLVKNFPELILDGFFPIQINLSYIFSLLLRLGNAIRRPKYEWFQEK